MLTVRKPSDQLIRQYIGVQSQLSFTYREVGATAANVPESYAVDHTRVELGRGEAIVESARQALARWRHFELGWLNAWPQDTPIREGETVAIVVRAAGFWWLNAARIVYVVDETSDSTSRFGFAYGTLPGHVESGEERFLVDWNRDDDTVHYEILAFSRPRHFLTRLAKRRVRRLQKRFAQESAEAMRRAVNALRES